MDTTDIMLSLKLAFAFTFIPFSLMGQSTITVTTLDDNTTGDGQVTLREAIQAANSNTSVDGSEAGTGADTIVFSAGLNGTITFGSAGLEITETLIIDGDNRITVSGNDVDGIFFLFVSDPGIDLTVENITLTSFKDSFPPVFDFSGSANGTLTIENSTISNNENNTRSGGAIGIGTGTTANLVVKNSVFSSNTVSSSNSGGALHLASSGSSYSIEDSEFTNNSSQNGFGGAINAADGALTINRTIFSGNSADDGGSAIEMDGIGNVNILNSLFFENTTNGTVSGGTIEFFNHSANANIINSTITDNIDNGSNDTGGVLADNSDVTLSNTIVANNDGSETNTLNGGSFTGSDIGSGGDNIIRDSISSLFVDATTDDYDIQDGSIAVDAGNNTAANDAGLTTDINGNTRIVNSVVDIGAFENQTVSSTVPTVTTTSVSTFDATSATLGGNVTDDGGETVTERGIVWNTTGSPDTGDNQVAIGSGTGSYSQSVGLLPFGTQIFVRAYATNSEGTAYGSEESFTTSGTVSVNLTGAEGWRLLSVPDDVALSTFLDPIWTQGATSGGDTDFGTPNVYTWNTATDGNDPADWQAVTDLTSTTLAGGHGVLVQVYADPDYDGPTSPGFPQTLSVTGSEFVSGTSPTMNSNATGWTLLGNPFASAIVYSQISPTNLSGIVYTWDPNDDLGDGGQAGQDTGSWKTWNGSSGNLTGGRIAPFQGFLVQNSTTGSSVTFAQSSKTNTATTFLGKEPQNQVPFVRMELQGNGMRNSTWLEFTSDGSVENTTGDAWELTPLSSNYALLATRKADGSLVDIGRYPDGSDLEIPLITEATHPGRYTLHVTDFEAAGQTLYLNDLQTGESILLEEGTRYEFGIDAAAKAPSDPFALLKSGLKKQADNEHRFVISSSAIENQGDETPDRFTLEQNYPNPFNPTTVIRYQLPVSSEVRLELFDMAGRQIATLVSGQKEAGSHSVNFDGSSLSSGVYMYRLEASGISLTKKLTLIK